MQKNSWVLMHHPQWSKTWILCLHFEDATTISASGKVFIQKFNKENIPGLILIFFICNTMSKPATTTKKVPRVFVVVLLRLYI